MNARRSITVMGAVGLLTITSLVLANTPSIKKWWTNNPPPPQEAGSDWGKKDPAQLALSAELAGWLKPFDSTNKAFAYEALLTAIDRTDSAHAMINVDYKFCKNGQACYLRIGRQETISTSQAYLVVDHEAKRIILTASKELIQVPGFQVNELYDYIRGEGYTMVRKTENGLPVISMSNPDHISCKEFAVQYDSTARQVKRIFFRQADIADHMDPNLEKWVTLKFEKWNDEPGPGQVPNIETFVSKHQGKWTGTPAYSHYELLVR